jgi:hypothetical protein
MTKPFFVINYVVTYDVFDDVFVFVVEGGYVVNVMKENEM